MTAILLLCAVALAAGAGPAEKIQALLARPKVLCGRFEQSKQLVGLKKPVTSNGRFCVIAGKGVLWRSLQPFPNTVKVTRDEIVQMRGERVTQRLDARREPALRMINDLLFALFAGDLAQLDKLFIIEGDARDGHWTAALKPREPALAKAVGAIALEGGAYVKNLTISEANGDITKLSFAAIQTGEGALSAEEAALF